MYQDFRFQPGWATPVIAQQHAGFFAKFFRLAEERGRCQMRKQGKCPGRDQCHDCHWSENARRG